MSYLRKFEGGIKKHITENNINLEDQRYCLTDSGKLFADGIASDLFL